MATNIDMQGKWEWILGLGVLDKHEAWAQERLKAFGRDTSFVSVWFPQVTEEFATLAEPALGSKHWAQISNALGIVRGDNTLYARRASSVPQVSDEETLVAIDALVEKAERELAWFAEYISETGLTQAKRDAVKEPRHYFNKIKTTYERLLAVRAEVAAKVAS